MKKILLLGAPGSGKSTLAKMLHTITRLPVIHLDSLFWKPGWVETPKAAWLALQQELIQGEEWIIDGTYQSTLDVRLEAAGVIIFLDMPRILCLWRVIKRHILYWGRSRPDLARGCPEKMTWGYLKKVWNFPVSDREMLIKRLSNVSGEKHIIWLTSKSEVSDFLKELRIRYEKV